MPMDPDQIDYRLITQSGVISRRQVVAAGGDPNDVRRLVRRREWAQLYPGVVINHTGEPSWQQRAWGAVLFAAPAALAGRSALRAAGVRETRRLDDNEPIDIAISHDRRVRPPADVRVTRVVDLEQRVLWRGRPPRLRVEEASLDVASEALRVRAPMTEVIEVLAASVRGRATSPDRLIEAIARRAKVPHRRMLSALLVDLGSGTCSALEHGYLVNVERPHGLPRPERQFHERIAGGSVFRDAEYRRLGVSIELDGRMFHGRNDQHDRDLDRDLVLASRSRLGVRLGWGQVFDRPCVTAGRVAAVLRSRGWSGSPALCGPGCPALRAFNGCLNGLPG